MIPKDKLVVGMLYECKARNFTVGLWDGEAFVYDRHKFGQVFKDREYHWDDGPPYGTVKPICLYEGGRGSTYKARGTDGGEYGWE